MEEPPRYRIETFDALLRDLVAWGLVARTGKTRTSWHLTSAAQRRLDELVRPLGPLDVDQLVYLDHVCAGCHDRTLTRLEEGLYICDACRQRRRTEVTEKEVTDSAAGSRRLLRRHRPNDGVGRSLTG